MRIYIAHDGDTLRTIAQKTNSTLEALVSLNPAITGLNENLDGTQVRLPASPASATWKINLPLCPPFSAQAFGEPEWIPLSSLEDMQRVEYDVLIVGTGAGGGAALWRLIQQLGASGKRIGVLERGGLILQTHAQNIATMNPLRLVEYKRKMSAFIPGYDAPQIYAFGGRTLFWGLTSPRMAISELVKWPVPIEEMGNYYTIAEKVMSVTGNYTKGALLTQMLLNRLQRNGFPDAIDEPLAVNLEPVSQY